MKEVSNNLVQLVTLSHPEVIQKVQRQKNKVQVTNSCTFPYRLRVLSFYFYLDPCLTYIHIIRGWHPSKTWVYTWTDIILAEKAPSFCPYLQWCDILVSYSEVGGWRPKLGSIQLVSGDCSDARNQQWDKQHDYMFIILYIYFLFVNHWLTDSALRESWCIVVCWKIKQWTCTVNACTDHVWPTV